MTASGPVIDVDEDGFLENRDSWSEATAEALAARENLLLGPEHWELIRLVRQFYDEYGFSPSMRPLVKYAGTHLGVDKGRSIYLMKLFPPSPARQLSKIAGLPKPRNCL